MFKYGNVSEERESDNVGDEIEKMVKRQTRERSGKQIPRESRDKLSGG